MITKYLKNKKMPMWRNWQTHQTQNLAGNHVGSSPTIGTNDVSVRTNKTDRYKYHSRKDDIFLLVFSVCTILSPSFVPLVKTHRGLGLMSSSKAFYPNDDKYRIILFNNIKI